MTGRGGTALRVVLAVVVMLLGDILLIPLLLLDVVTNNTTDAAETAVNTAATLTSSLFVLLLTWLLVTRLDGGRLSDLRLRVDRRALAWMLAMVVVAAAIAAATGTVMGLLGIATTSDGLKGVSLPVLAILILGRVNAGFLAQGFPEELV